MNSKINVYRKRFLRLSGVIKVLRSEKDYYSIVFSATAKIGVRSKYLFLSIIDMLEKQNIYGAFVLTRAYLENTAALGFLTIKFKKALEENKIEEISKPTIKFLLGGRGFPEKKHIEQSGKVFVEATRVGNLIKEVDQDLYNRGKNKKGFPEKILGDMYYKALSEFSHPNFLALTLCSKVVNSNDIINFDKSGSIQDEKFCIIHLNLISGIFFDYWGKQESLVSKYYKLPKI